MTSTRLASLETHFKVACAIYASVATLPGEKRASAAKALTKMVGKVTKGAKGTQRQTHPATKC